MRYNTKMECARYLNDVYGKNVFNNIVRQKNLEKGYDERVLSIIRKEYDIFFENMYNNIELEYSSEKIQNLIKEFDIFIDLVYSNSKEVLKIYANIFLSEEAYIKKFNSYDNKLGDYIVEAIKYDIN